jgi:thiamine biosynthesis lipoprotein
MVDISENRLHAFGKSCHLIIDNSDGRGTELLSRCQDEIVRLENKFSSYMPRSIISQINQAAGTGHSVPLDAEARSLFEYVTALWDESKHVFDPTTRVLMDCYGSGGELAVPQNTMKKMLKLVGWVNLELKPQGAQMSCKGMRIDLNQCIRPYALDSLRKLLLRNGTTNAYIEMDQDAVTIGKQPDGANWLVGARIPKGSRAAIVRLKLNNMGYAMRGDFEQTSNQSGETFGRALSPVDGQPIPGLLSVAVIAENCLTACGAANVARFKTEVSALKWLQKLGLPWLAVDRRYNCHGPLARGI